MGQKSKIGGSNRKYCLELSLNLVNLVLKTSGFLSDGIRNYHVEEKLFLMLRTNKESHVDASFINLEVHLNLTQNK